MLTKSQQLLYYIINKRGQIEDKTKLAKLQYFSDFIHFAFNDSAISQDTIIYTKQKQGPLSRSFNDDLTILIESGLVTESPKYHYKINTEKELNLLPKEKATIDYVLKKYGELSFSELVDICHTQAPFLSAQKSGVIEFFTAYNLVDEYPDYNTSA